MFNSHKSRKLAQGKFAVRQGKNRKNTENLKMSRYPAIGTRIVVKCGDIFQTKLTIEMQSVRPAETCCYV